LVQEKDAEIERLLGAYELREEHSRQWEATAIAAEANMENFRAAGIADHLRAETAETKLAAATVLLTKVHGIDCRFCGKLLRLGHADDCKYAAFLADPEPSGAQYREALELSARVVILQCAVCSKEYPQWSALSTFGQCSDC